MPPTESPTPRAGRPAYAPTDQARQTARAMTAYGIEQTQICAVLGITEKTLPKHFRTEIETAVAQANTRVAGALLSGRPRDDL